MPTAGSTGRPGPGVALLRRWGVLDKVIATGCPPLDRAVYRIADIRIEGCSIPVDGHRAAYAPRRYLLDEILADAADAAVASGMEFRQGRTVTEVLSDDEGQATGVRCRTSDGATTEEHARLMVGADGMRLEVRRCPCACTLTWLPPTSTTARSCSTNAPAATGSSNLTRRGTTRP
ncbi:FAD-dependent oxidoreductase [Streptomyces tubercidicus]|uniref:FAD-binding domain-containing protein n=1 Tax=Streptomyces tubercidicus TaxID=47759 RepID=A0A640US63_9ACTN|nr:FAD-dependent monooxygenase [Streptomyces tubercidicus]WAU12723.1 FAD-dependent monooxygenase [Streptomyces tubercidicus]GFE38212.1 hypothetical protein Stube_28850 [Streptomyces tubercidicus]